MFAIDRASVAHRPFRALHLGEVLLHLNLRDRFWQSLLISSTLAFSWLAMQVVHEAGHVLHLLATGGSIEQLTLHPLELSHTLPSANPCPFVTAVGGPLWGGLIKSCLDSAVYLALGEEICCAPSFSETG